MGSWVYILMQMFVIRFLDCARVRIAARLCVYNYYLILQLRRRATADMHFKCSHRAALCILLQCVVSATATLSTWLHFYQPANWNYLGVGQRIDWEEDVLFYTCTQYHN